MTVQFEQSLSAQLFDQSLRIQTQARSAASVAELFRLTSDVVSHLVPQSCLSLWIWDETKRRACRAHCSVGSQGSRHANHPLTLSGDSDIVRLFQSDWVESDAGWIPAEQLEFADRACPGTMGLAYMQATTTDGLKLLFTACVPAGLDLDFRAQLGFLRQLSQTFVSTVERIRLTRERDLLSRIAQLEVGSHSRQEFFDKAASELAQAFDALGCSIFLHDPARDVLILGGTTGLFDPKTKQPLTPEELRQVNYHRKEGLTGWMFANETSVRMYDAADPDECKAVGLEGGNSSLSRSAESPDNGRPRPFLGALIAIKGQVVGVIRLHGKKSNACFLPSDERCLEQISVALAHAIQHWKTSIEYRDELRFNGSVLDVVVGLQLEQESNSALRTIASETKRLFDARAVTVLVVDSERGTFRVGVGVAEGSSLSGDLDCQRWLHEKVVKNKQTIALRDVNSEQCDLPPRGDGSVRSLAAVPIQLSNDVLGVLLVENEQLGFFDPTDARKLQLLELLAARTAPFIFRKRPELALQASHLIHHFVDQFSAFVGPIVDLSKQMSSLPHEQVAQRLNVLGGHGESALGYWDRLKREVTFDRPNLQRGSLNGILESADWMISALAKKKSLRVRRNVDLQLNDELRHIEYDSLYLHIILSHLVSNAVDASTDQGELELKTELTSDGGARVSVRDCGCGMSEHDLNRAFRESFTTKSSQAVGSGNGLMHVARLMEVRAGRFGLESRQGEGTTVWVEFSCCPRRGNDG